jgi:hypothetical protein
LEQNPPPCNQVLGGVSPTHKFLGHDFSFAKNHLYILLAMSKGRDPEAEAARNATHVVARLGCRGAMARGDATMICS